MPLLTSKPVPIGVAFSAGPLLLLLGVGLIYVGIISIRGQLPRNGRLGIRTPSTLESDAAWHAAHRAAGPWIIAAAFGTVVPAAVALFRAPNDTFTLITMVGLGLMVALVAVASLAANAAAEAAEVESAGHARQDQGQKNRTATDESPDP